MKQSELFKLLPKDLIKGFITAVLTVIVTSLTAALSSGVFPTDFVFWKTQIFIGLSAGGAYLIKNFLTNKDDQFLKKD